MHRHSYTFYYSLKHMENLWKNYAFFQLFHSKKLKKLKPCFFQLFSAFSGFSTFFQKKSLTLVCGPETRTRSVAPRQGLGLWPLRGSYLRQGLGLWPLRGSYLRQALGLWPLRGSYLGAWPKNLGPKKMTYVQQAGNHAPKKMTYIQPPCDHAPKKT